MKNKVSFLAIIAIMFGAGYVHASECIGDDCEIETEEPIVFEQNFGPTNYVDFDDDEDDFDDLDDEPLKPILSQSIQFDPEPQIVEYSPTPVEYETCEYSEQNVTCTYDDNCPFATEAECAIWHKKPIHKTALLPRAPHLNTVRTDDILYAIYANYDVDASEPAMAPLVERYNILMRASSACCNAGILHKMREKGASEKEIYQFLKDDANYFAVTKRCMVMNDDEFDSSYSNGVTGKMAIEVRNACLCKNRQWFETLLQPFFDVYYHAPMFEDRPFVYSYRDDMQRDVTVYINDEVHTTMGLLGACPK